MCADAYNYDILRALDVERLERLYLDRADMQFSDGDVSIQDADSDGQWEQWEEDREEDGEMQEGASYNTPRVETFNLPLYTVNVETTDSVGCTLTVSKDSGISSGTAITNLMSWKEDHEIPVKAFDNLLHIIKQLLPPGNRLPKTEEGAHNILQVSPPGQFERHWCRARRDGKGCGCYVYPPLKNGHTQYSRQEVQARDEEGVARCPKCNAKRFEEVGMPCICMSVFRGICVSVWDPVSAS